MEKQNILDGVKLWFSLDEKISTLNKEIKNLKTQKKEISQGLLTKMKEHDIKTFETKNGNLVHTERTVKSAITKKHLINCLEKLIQKDSDREKIIDYIYESRDTKLVDGIKRK